MTGRAPGWDQKKIKRVADDYFEGDRINLALHIKANTTVKNWHLRLSQEICRLFGSIEDFSKKYPPLNSVLMATDLKGPVVHVQSIETNPSDLWSPDRSVHMTSFWDWTPETWGTVGYTRQGRRATVVENTSNPFLMVCYVTKQATGVDPSIRGMVMGFYLVSHVLGDRNEFIAPALHEIEPDRWRYSLKALRAFNFLPEYRLHIDTLDPSIVDRAQAVSQYGEEVRPEILEKLKAIPYREVPVFGGLPVVDTTIKVPEPKKHKVKAGPVNRSGYTVDGEPIETEKELYALVLSGDTDAFLGEPSRGRNIYKIGLSISPVTRLEAIQKCLPNGAFHWRLFRNSRKTLGYAYPSFETAEAGEDAMKDVLGKSGRWLGGEFYAATNEEINTAWQAGHFAAIEYQAQEDKAND